MKHKIFAHIDKIPPYFVKHGQFETRIGVDSWDLFKLRDWVDELIILVSKQREDKT